LIVGNGSNLPTAADSPAYDMPFAPPSEERLGGAGFTVPQIWNMVRAHLLLSIGIFVVLVGLSFVVIKSLPKSYFAVATLIVNSDNTDPLAGRNYPIGTNSFFSTHVELLRNNVMLQPVVDRLDLKNDELFVDGFEGTPNELNDMVLNKLRQSLQVEPGAGSQLLYISATALSAQLAADIANGVADEYLRQTNQRVNAPAIERAARYSSQLEELKSNVSIAQSRVAEFRQKHGLTDLKDGPGGELASNTLVNLQDQLLTAQNARRQLEAQRVDGEADSADVLEAEETLELRAKLGELEGELGQASATLGQRHPRIRQLQSEIEATRKALQAAVRARYDSSALALTRARELEAKYQAAVNAERQRLMARSSVQEEGAKLLLELRTAEEAYAKALSGRDEVQFASQGNYQDVTLVSRAEAPLRPARPNKLKMFLIAIAASFALALGVPFAYELFLNRRIRCRDDLERSFRILTLAEFGPMSAPKPA